MPPCPIGRTTWYLPPSVLPTQSLDDSARRYPSLWTCADRRETVRETVFAGSTPLLDARSSATVAAFSASVAAFLSFAATAARTFFTCVRTALSTERLRRVRLIRWRLRFSADG